MRPQPARCGHIELQNRYQIAVTPGTPARYLELSRTLESRDDTEFAVAVF
jgi:hypothetical protein